MNKKLYVLILAVCCLAMLTGCFCQHEWKDPTCVDPSTCAKCEKTEGEALGHTWLDADCVNPKTCDICAATEGDALGHTWVDADCLNPKTCQVCAVTEGEALGHDWQDATTELPQTCAVCAVTEGERIITDPRFTTAKTAAIQGKWSCVLHMTGEAMGMDDFENGMDLELIVNFSNDGALTMSCTIANEEAFMDALVAYTVETTYADFASQGYNKEAADQLVKETSGMTMEEYIRSYLETFDFNSMFEGIFSALNAVYYMEDDVLYTGLSWDLPMEVDSYTLENGTLVIDSLNEEMGQECVFTRVEK